MMVRDDSHGWSDAPKGDSDGPSGGAPGDADADVDAVPGPGTGAAATGDPAASDSASTLVPPPAPVPLLRAERHVASLVPDARGRAGLEAAIEQFQRELAAAEAGAAPLTGGDPPRTLQDLVDAAGTLARPVAAACRPDPAEAPADDALHRALAGWVLAVMVLRLATVARERGRSLVPAELVAGIPEFAARHVASARAGHGVDRAFLRESLLPVRTIADAAWCRLGGTDEATELADPGRRRALFVLLEHARHRLVRLERWHYESCLAEPVAGWSGAWSVALLARFGRPVWRAPDGRPPRPVLDDIGGRLASGSSSASASPPAAHEEGDAAGRADGSARADDAA